MLTESASVRQTRIAHGRALLRVLACAAVLAFILGRQWGESALGASFEVEGVMTMLSGLPDGGTLTSNVFRFEVRVDGERWFVRRANVLVEAGVTTNWLHKELACDGRDLYRTDEFPRNAVMPGSRTTTNLLYGYAEDGHFPRSGTSADRILWLAYCSAADLSDNELIPSIRAPKDVDCRPLRMEIERLQVDGLPLRFQQTCPGYITKREGKAVTRVAHYPPPFDAGWVDFEYQVDAFTNFMGTAIPLLFSAGFYLPLETGGAEMVRFCTTSVSGLVTRVSSLKSAVEMPAFGQRANVYDYRFTNSAGRPLMYVEQKEEHWLRRTDEKLREAIQAKQHMLPVGKRQASGTTRLLVLAVLGCVSTGPLIILAARKWRSRQDSL